MQKKNISVSYKNKLYLFPKADANYSDDSLNHTVILTDEILLEGTSKGWGKNISRKKIGTRTLDEFINSMKETVTAIGREPKNSNLNIGFRKKEDLETVFFIIDRISEKGWKHIYLALTRESSTDVDSSSCLTTLMSELVYEPKMKKAGLVGGRKKEDIANIVNEHLSALRFHYHEWLKDNKKKTGKITVKMTINSSGRVVEAQIFNNTFNDEDFEHIVLKEIREWRFGKMDNKDDKTEIVYPFVFEE
jgi:TonB family protein